MTGPSSAKARSCGPRNSARATPTGIGTRAASHGTRVRCRSGRRWDRRSRRSPPASSAVMDVGTTSWPSPAATAVSAARRSSPEPQGRGADDDDGGGVHGRRPLDGEAVDDDAVRRAEVLDDDAGLARPGRPRGPATAPRRAAPARLPVPGRPPVPAGRAGGCVRHPALPPRRGGAGGSAAWTAAAPADGDRRAVDERRQAEGGIRRDRRDHAWTGEPRARRGARRARRRGRAAVCGPDQRTRTSTGRGRRRGTCTVSVISMAATVGTRTDGGARVIHRLRPSGCENRAARVR